MNRYYLRAQTQFWRHQIVAWTDIHAWRGQYRYERIRCASRIRAFVKATRNHFQMLPF